MANYALGASAEPCYPLSIPSVASNESTWEIFPNPATNSIKISGLISNQSQKQLYNAIGQLVLSTIENEIAIGHLPKGVYYLKCISSNKTIVAGIKKVVVE